MASQTVTLNVRLTKSQYEKLDEMVDLGDYTSKGEYIRALLRRDFDAQADYLYQKALRDRDKHISLEECAKKWGLEQDSSRQ